MNIPELITDIGDSSVLGAVAVITALFFLFHKCHREAAVMVLSFVTAGAIIGALKIAFIGCGHDFLGIRSPSGHAALSVSILGTYALVLFRRSRSYIFPGLLFTLGIIIALTRITLHFHTTPEVLLGIAVGFATILILRTFVLRNSSSAIPTPPYNIYILLALTALAACLVYGTRLPAETAFKQIAAQLKIIFPQCH